MKGIRKIALTPYYPYGKNKEKIIEERTEQVDKAISEHDLEIRADERERIIDLIDRHLWNYSKEVWEDFQSVLKQLKEQK